MSLSIRQATAADSALVFSFVRELADYEKLSDELAATEQAIAAVLFAAEPRVFCDIAEWNGEPVGFAVWFSVFSTFRGRYGLYLEDVFVRQPFRNKGIGRALLQRLAARCVENDWARMEWTVLDWNAPSIAFYRLIGADILDQWKICRLSGDALAKFAAHGANR